MRRLPQRGKRYAVHNALRRTGAIDDNITLGTEGQQRFLVEHIHFHDLNGLPLFLVPAKSSIGIPAAKRNPAAGSSQQHLQRSLPHFTGSSKQADRYGHRRLPLLSTK
ncbi:hypothetical protein D3C75_993530 [compost metagenome]